MNYKIAQFLFAPFLLAVFFLISLLNNNLFSIIIREDQIIEYSQFFILLVSTFIALKISHTLSVKKIKILAVIYLLAASLCFFVAGEEISWGQRLLRIETPEFYADLNVQEETTIHNLYFIHYKVGYGYMAIGLYGALSWLLFKLIKLKAPFISPPWYLTIFFISGFIYNFSGQFIPINLIWSWAEISELMLQLGIFLFLIERFNTLRKTK